MSIVKEFFERHGLHVLAQNAQQVQGFAKFIELHIEGSGAEGVLEEAALQLREAAVHIEAAIQGFVRLQETDAQKEDEETQPDLTVSP